MRLMIQARLHAAICRYAICGHAICEYAKVLRQEMRQPARAINACISHQWMALHSFSSLSEP